MKSLNLKLFYLLSFFLAITFQSFGKSCLAYYSQNSEPDKKQLFSFDPKRIGNSNLKITKALNSESRKFLASNGLVRARCQMRPVGPAFVAAA